MGSIKFTMRAIKVCTSSSSSSSSSLGFRVYALAAGVGTAIFAVAVAIVQLPQLLNLQAETSQQALAEGSIAATVLAVVASSCSSHAFAGIASPGAPRAAPESGSAPAQPGLLGFVLGVAGCRWRAAGSLDAALRFVRSSGLGTSAFFCGSAL